MAGSLNLLVEELRNYVVDLEDFNFLNLKEEELLDEQLEKAVLDGAIAYDLVPPISSTDVTTSAFLTKGNLTGTSETARTWYFIKRFASLEVLDVLIKIHIRNRNQVNDQGFQVEEFGKASEWSNLRTQLRTELKKDLSEYKRILQFAGFDGSQTISLYHEDVY